MSRDGMGSGLSFGSERKEGSGTDISLQGDYE